MKALTDVQVDYALKTTHSRWRLEGKFIRRDFVFKNFVEAWGFMNSCLLYTSPSPRDVSRSRMPSSA